jgi:hypothetical protein
MKTKTLTPMGALHPILFFAGVYVVVLLFSIFICSVLFYSCNSSASSIGQEKSIPLEQPARSSNPTAAVIMR